MLAAWSACCSVAKRSGYPNDSTCLFARACQLNKDITSLHALHRLDPFRNLPEPELKWLARHMSLQTYPKKTVILKQDESSDYLAFILTGFVKVYRGGSISQLAKVDNRRRPRKEVALAILGTGHMVGEAAALAQTKRTASVVALSDCTLVQFEFDAFMECARRNPEVALFVMQYLANRVIAANRQIDLQLASIESRVVALLRNLGEIGLPPSLYPSNAEIGRMVGTSREMVSRIVKKPFDQAVNRKASAAKQR